ncbi:MAG: T9SS type A sorting domain-containing protein [Candidatus Kapabacteria bacterium]|nr:T9SS type A sorting domain-containing protein [Candidatus Kapabacteria bacterium]
MRSQHTFFCKGQYSQSTTFALIPALLMSLCFLWMLLAFANILTAQTIPISPKTIKDSKGRDFWLAFPRNHHQTDINLDRLYISIASERITRGRIEFRQAGRLRTENFSLSANDVFTLELPVSGLEIDEDIVSRKSFHIIADEEVSVYGLTVANTTSDAFLAFPTDVLGREYVITSYPSNLTLQNNGRTVNTVASTMSQFALLAVEDSTVVHIRPTARVWGASTVASFTVVLNQGETYLVSNYLVPENALIDYTGSRVTSTKPLVVYSGHERAAIPINSASSRDCLIEQMLPLEVWGKTALVVPYPRPTQGGADFGCDRIRVVAGYDNTIVQVNSVTVATLPAGGFYEMVISTEASVVTSEPSMVSGYKCSSQRPGNTTIIGDPFLAVIPPVEQYLTRYRFNCVQGLQVAQGGFSRFEPAFQEHFVTVIVPSTKATTVVLDGRAVLAQNFRRIPQSDYSYASIQIGEGTHSINADTTFGITVAGYGRANSYGYIGGQRFETDIRPPQIVVNRSCTGLRGMTFDSNYTDSKIFFYDTLSAAQRNIRFRFGSLPRPADSLSFEADLLNPYEDGSLGLIVVDSLDLRTVQRIVVPGFTVHRDPTIRTNAVVSTSSIMRLATGRDYCFRLNLTNYGATNQTIQNVGFARGLRQFSSNLSRPVRIEPRTQGTVEYCFRSNEDGLFIDTLTITNGCITRPILAIRIEAAQDRFAPVLAKSSDSCNRTTTFEASDNRTFDAGLDKIEMSLINLTPQQTFIGDAASVPDSTKRPVRLTLTVVNPRADAVYALRFIDSVGNVTTAQDTIRGFTARFIPSPDTTTGTLRTVSVINGGNSRQEYRFTAVEASMLTCGTIAVQNTGIVPFVFEQSYLSRNVNFSLPPAQLPFVIPAGARRLLTVCFNPPLVANYRDTISITRFCITDQIALVGEGLTATRFAGTRCDAIVRLTPRYGSGSAAQAQTLSIRHYPDPANDHFSLSFEVAETQALTVNVYSMLGTLVASLPKQRFETGAYQLTLNVPTLEAGAYYCEVQSDKPDVKRWTGLVRIAR